MEGGGGEKGNGRRIGKRFWAKGGEVTGGGGREESGWEGKRKGRKEG